MSVLHENLHGLDRDRLLAALEPVLRAHNVEGVELLWRTDRSGPVLELTVERPDSRVPGEGITIDLCSDISRDLSAALDVADVIPTRYSLQVGSPGVERRLYQPGDYARFAGRSVRIKLTEPIASEHVVRGVLKGLSEQGNVLVETDQGLLSLALDQIEKARLILEWGSGKPRPGQKARSAADRRKRRSNRSK